MHRAAGLLVAARDRPDRAAQVLGSNTTVAWEERSRGTSYYTRSRRVGGQVVREYVGGGLIGALTADEDAEQQARRAREAADLKAERERWEALEAPLKSLDARASALMRATLLLAGYRQHDRGEWRKRRGD